MRLHTSIQRRLNKGKPALKVYWWRYDFPAKLNFGDEITPYIIEKLWGLRVDWADKDECELIGAGSILHFFQEPHKDKSRIKVWGSGFIKEGPNNTNNRLDFYAVRGPLSRERIGIKSRVILGDPGILVNRVFQASKVKTHKVGIVAHYVDASNELLNKVKDDPKYVLIDPLESPQNVAYAITSCEYILSSSLHGLIFADSFGVPNNWMPLSDKVVGGSYKFEDYYGSTNRALVQKDANEILGNEALIEHAINQYQKVQHLKKMQDLLIDSFPYQIKFRIKPAIAFVLSPAKLKKLFR